MNSGTTNAKIKKPQCVQGALEHIQTTGNTDSLLIWVKQVARSAFARKSTKLQLHYDIVPHSRYKNIERFWYQKSTVSRISEGARDSNAESWILAALIRSCKSMLDRFVVRFSPTDVDLVEKD